MNNDEQYEDKVVLITGSGRGIGRAIALEFAERGAHVVVNFFRNRKPAEGTLKEIERRGRKGLVIKANMGNIGDIERMFRKIKRSFGGIDFLINNAASGYNRPVMQQSVKGWDWTMNINARALLFCAQIAAPMMEKRGGGAIVSLSSPGANRVIPDYVVVGASKAALEALTRYLAIELAPMNIVVNAISPGVVNTEALQFFSQGKEDDLLEKLAASNPSGRLVEPGEVAKLTAFLCSPEAQMIRGQTIVMDGGRTLLIEG
ncbi:MAG: enoyl-[acyl-carrier-protein] reductase FabL [Anaerolineae bacterium]|nr:enoyl-[acyl-carrier-protein] reductase FabL [Anaerolineae bacterium]